MFPGPFEPSSNVLFTGVQLPPRRSDLIDCRLFGRLFTDIVTTLSSQGTLTHRGKPARESITSASVKGEQ